MVKVSSTRHIKIQADLDRIGELRRESKRLRTEAAELAEKTIPAAIQAKLSVTEIARRAGYTRKAIYDITAKE